MPMIEIYVFQTHLDRAARIAKLMFPENPDTVSAINVIEIAAARGMESLRNEWNNTDAQSTEVK